MVTLDLDDLKERVVERQINWGLIGAIVLAVIGWALAGAGDYSKVRDRVTTLETQRANDTQRLERIENKLDRMLERTK